MGSLTLQICITKLTTIGSDNSLTAGRRHAIIWNNAGTLLILDPWEQISGKS